MRKLIKTWNAAKEMYEMLWFEKTPENTIIRYSDKYQCFCDYCMRDK